MAKRPTLTDVGSGFLSAASINNNNDAIEAAFDNTLSRDGSSPNAMGADLDMNSNDILNAASGFFSNLTIGGVLVVPPELLPAEQNNFSFDSRVDVEARNIPVTTNSILVFGYTSFGDGGGGPFTRSATEPVHEGKLQSNDGAWWELVHQGEVRATQFGAVEDGDVTSAIQNAFNFAAYGNTATPAEGSRKSKPCRVLIDIHKGTLSDTIQVGYGFDFQSSYIRGLGATNTDADHHMGTCLTCTMKDRPAFAINAARDSTISDLTIIGAAFSELQTVSLLEDETPTLEATWETALDDAGITRARYTPYAGVAIDAYAGTAPGTAYPDVTCPSWIEASFTQYGKKRSSAPKMLRMTIRGFEVGVAQTPSDMDSNGDFPVMEWLRIQDCKYAFSGGNNQCRIPFFGNCQFNGHYTTLVNNVHGKQNGGVGGMFLACGWGGFCGNLFKINSLSRAGGLTFQNCDVEALHRIGDVATGSGTAQIPIWFRNCSINFRHSETNGHPANVFNGNGTQAVIGFSGGDVRWFSVGSFVSSRVAVTDGTMINFDDTTGSRAKAYGQIASNALAGGFVVAANAATPEFDCLYATYDLLTNSVDGAATLGPTARKTTRKHTVPLWSPEVQRGPTTTTSQRREALKRPILMDRRNRSTYGTPPVRSGLTITFTTTLATNEQNAVQLGYMNGGVIVDNETGTTMFIRSVDHGTGVVIAEMQNNYVSDGAGGFDLMDTAFDPATGIWNVYGTGVYLAPQVIKGTTDSSTAVITVAAMLDSPQTDYGLAVGDWLFEDLSPPESTFVTSPRAEIASISTGGSTITLSGNCGTTHATALPFDWWIKGEVSNEAAR